MSDIELSVAAGFVVGCLAGFLLRCVYSVSLKDYTQITLQWKALHDRAQEAMTEMMTEIVRLNDECRKLKTRGHTVSNSQKWEISHPVGIQGDSVTVKPSDFQSDK